MEEEYLIPIVSINWNKKLLQSTVFKTAAIDQLPFIRSKLIKRFYQNITFFS